MIRAPLLCLLLTGCTHEIVRYERVNVAVPVLPEVPAHLLEDYPGDLPMASEAGVICFVEQDAKALQEWMLWHKLKVNQLRGVLIND
jgi:hypothetical protein